MQDYPPIYVWADEFKTEEVLMNYYSNALNHIGGENIIEIKLTQQEDKVRISVFNTGEPIPADSIDIGEDMPRFAMSEKVISVSSFTTMGNS